MKHPGGRPTKYNEVILEAVEQYLKQAVPENMEIATVEGLALYLGLSKNTLYEWAKEYKKFSDALEKLRDIQKQQLIKTGVFGGKEINSNIIMLLLKVNHDMIETSKQLVETKTNLVRIDINNERDKTNQINKPATQATLGAGDTT